MWHFRGGVIGACHRVCQNPLPLAAVVNHVYVTVAMYTV
jgi:predicted membrane chloride channel (bestrophin family)